uniref:Putative secreted protein n=1 Tax=Ixodes ricinus TaxID=34613 RepID=A0A6B0UCS4_IXORI
MTLNFWKGSLSSIMLLLLNLSSFPYRQVTSRTGSATGYLRKKVRKEKGLAPMETQRRHQSSNNTAPFRTGDKKWRNERRQRTSIRRREPAL